MALAQSVTIMWFQALSLTLNTAFFGSQTGAGLKSLNFKVLGERAPASLVDATFVAVPEVVSGAVLVRGPSETSKEGWTCAMAGILPKAAGIFHAEDWPCGAVVILPKPAGLSNGENCGVAVVELCVEVM